MGRVRRAFCILVCCLCLSGCKRPIDYDNTDPYNSFSGMGYIPGGEFDPNVSYGREDWTFNPDNYSGMTEDEAWIQFQIDQANYWRQYQQWQNEQALQSQSQSSTSITSTDDEPSEPEVIKPTFENVSYLTKDELIRYFGARDAVGYFSSQYSEVYSDSGHLALVSDKTYMDAVAMYDNLFGYHDVEFVFEGRTECYWFVADKVYSVAQFDGYVTESESPVCSEHHSYSDTIYSVQNLTNGVYQDMQPAYTLYKEYGSPYHEDFFNLIWKADSKWYAFNRRTHALSIVEVY